MKYTLNVSDYIVSSSEQEEREMLHQEAAKDLAEDIKNYDIESFNYQTITTVIPDSVPLKSNPKWHKRSFGAVNTVEQCGSMVFVSKLFLDEFGFRDITMDSIIKEIVNKHYRLWKLENLDKVLVFPKASVEGIKSAFPNNERIQSCNSLDKIYSITGQPVGIGGSMYFMDNLICSICEQNNIPITPYKDTRIREVDHIIDSLDSQCPVPLRVENSVYYDDPHYQGGHFVTLYGLDRGNAIVVDSNINSHAGINKLPVSQLFDAMIANPDLVCAWDTASLLSVSDDD